MSCKGKVCLVTGASRGIGLGIATALAKEGAQVYITGRHAAEEGRKDGLVGGGVAACASVNAVAASGGHCVYLVCDHLDDDKVESTIEGIFEKEGRLDLLVNNAFGGQDNDNVATKAIGQPFWQKPLWLWDAGHRVGLRSHYTATVFCARQWEKRNQRGALVANVSSPGGLDYLFDVSYGVAKTGVDRMSYDMAIELASQGVSVVSLWPGAVKTELVAKSAQDAKAEKKKSHTGTMGKGVFSLENLKGANLRELESVEFVGRGIAAMLSDDRVIERWSGRVCITSELAEFYGFTDTDGTLPWGFMKNFRAGAMSRPPPQWRPGPSRL
jgi:NAD(P)-dependent dehydrogenase (short-subunit alcohol dehydrogenase family)